MMTMMTTFGILLTLTDVMVLVLSIQVRLGSRRLADRIDELERRLDVDAAQAREVLAAYKLEVAKSYASVGLVKDVERRITGILVRIEAKLDTDRSAS